MNRIRLGVLVALAVIALSLPGVAQAQSCSTLSGTTVVLDDTNVTGFGIVVNVAVSYNVTLNRCTLTVSYVSNTASLTALGIDKFSWNTSTTATIFSCPSGWNCSTSSQTQDGFGSFNSDNADPGGTDTTGIVFVLSGNPTFTANASGSRFAAHVRFSNSCSGFVSDDPTTSASPNANCVPVPEPGTLSLFAAGLLGLAGMALRRLA